ncbi:hypothetical protein BASA81_005170 [Batrachochytrium salamandrivorans]|nr:hypothetical protein BASA81_005170 [Batrachochytrium salamandrivorans]
MASFQVVLGATCGVANVFFARGLMKQPAFFRPYEHVLGLGVGAYLGYSYYHWTQKKGQQLIEVLEKHNMDAQLIRYLLPRI